MTNQITAIIDVITREIRFNELGVSSVELDGGIWHIKFKMAEKFGQSSEKEFTPTNYSIVINYSQNDPALYSDGYTDPINSFEVVEDASWDDGKYIAFDWIPPAEASQKSGWLYFNVTITDQDNHGVWSTKTKKVRVHPRVTGGSDSSLTPSQSSKIDSLLQKLDQQIEDTAQEIVDDSQQLISSTVTSYLDSKEVLPLELESILSMCHPIGSYYYSDDQTNPGRLFGGVWEEVEGVFLLASQGSVYPAGSTGGYPTHTLTIDEMPKHNHPLGTTTKTEWSESGSGSKLRYTLKPSESGYYPLSGSTGTGEDMIKSVGDDQAFDIMPPYRAVYCWRRTA